MYVTLTNTIKWFTDGRRILRAWRVFAMFAAQGSIVAAGAAGPSTRPDQWTPKAVCDVLAWRESRLRNCSFSFSEDRRFFRPGKAGETLMSTDVASVKCKDGRVLVDFSETDLENHLLDVSHSLEEWDGKQCQWLQNVRTSKTATELQGGFDDAEPHIFHLANTFTMLGLRQYSESKPWSKWIGSLLAAKGTTATVSEGAEGGEPFVRLSVVPADDPAVRYDWTFLPDKDFVARDFDIAITQGDKNNGAQGWHVESLKKCDGFWAPAKITYSSLVMQTGNKGTVNITSFSLKPPSDHDMQINFPVGTHVIDAIKLQCYTVRPNGKRRYESFYDGATKKMINPPADATRAQPAATRP